MIIKRTIGTIPMVLFCLQRMKAFILFLLVFYSVAYSSFGQEGRISMVGRALSKYKNSCKKYYKSVAKEDVAHNEIMLLARGGRWWNISKSDSIFELNYGVKYKVFSCIIPENQGCLEWYNKIIFRHLNKMYGRKWKRTVREDAFGLKGNFKNE